MLADGALFAQYPLLGGFFPGGRTHGMLDEDAERQRENELKALEACLPGGVAFSLVETAKILNRSVRWTRQKTASGKLKSVFVGGTRRVIRPVIVAALLEGVEK